MAAVRESFGCTGGGGCTGVETIEMVAFVEGTAVVIDSVGGLVNVLVIASSSGAAFARVAVAVGDSGAVASGTVAPETVDLGIVNSAAANSATVSFGVVAHEVAEIAVVM